MRSFYAAIAAAGLLVAAVPAFAQSGAATPSCRSGDPVVWVNTGSNVYHMQGSKYYGNTKAGKYECQSQANASGAHQAKNEGGKSAVTGASPKPGATAPAAAGAAAGAAGAAGRMQASPAVRYTPVPPPSTVASPGVMGSPQASPSSGKRHRRSKASPSPAASGAASLSPTPKASSSPSAHHSRKKKSASPAPSPAAT